MDPLNDLKESLAYLFELQRKNTNEYINPLVQELSWALDNYKEDSSDSLKNLITAVKNAFPVIENYSDFYAIRLKMEALAAARDVN